MDASLVPDHSGGVMVALKVPAGTAARVAQDGGLSPDDLHCTLAYMGDASELSQEQRNALLEAAKETARAAYPLEGSFPAGAGTFNNPDNQPYWLDPGTPGIHSLRESLMRSFDLRGLRELVHENHPFNPHVTLGYLDTDDPQPPASTVPSPAPIVWGEMIVKIGDDVQTFPLGRSRPVVSQSLVSSAAEQNLRRQLDAHNRLAPLGARTTLETLRAVYLRGATAATASGRLEASSDHLGADRVRTFLASLSTRAPSPDQDLYPAEPTHSRLYESLRLAQELQADQVANLLLASAVQTSDPTQRVFTLNRALALSAASPVPEVRAALSDRIRALVADGNSRAARSLRARRQLRDRYGRWIEMGGNARFKISRPGLPGGGVWMHGRVVGQNVSKGNVNVRLDDNRVVAVPAEKMEQPLAVLRKPGGVNAQPPARDDENAPTVARLDTADPAPAPPPPPTPSEVRTALKDAGSELRKRIGDDSTEVVHRDALLNGVRDAIAGSDPEETREQLAELAEYADNVSSSNQGRMSDTERDAFRAYAEDLQDVIAASTDTPEPDRPRPAVLPGNREAEDEIHAFTDVVERVRADLGPEARPIDVLRAAQREDPEAHENLRAKIEEIAISRVGMNPDPRNRAWLRAREKAVASVPTRVFDAVNHQLREREKIDEERQAPSPSPSPSPSPESEPVAVSPTPSPEDVPEGEVPPLPELDEFADAASKVGDVARATTDVEAKSRLAAANNVIENVGDDFLQGRIDAQQAMDALQAARNEMDGVIDDHLDDLPEDGEDNLLEAMDGVQELHDKIQAWNDTPDPDLPATPESTDPLDRLEQLAEDLGGVESLDGEDIGESVSQVNDLVRDGEMDAARAADQLDDQANNLEDATRDEGPPRETQEQIDELRQIAEELRAGDQQAPTTDEVLEGIRREEQEAPAPTPEPEPEPEPEPAASEDPFERLEQLAEELGGVESLDGEDIGDSIQQITNLAQDGELDAARAADQLEDQADSLYQANRDDGPPREIQAQVDAIKEIADQLRSGDQQAPSTDEVLEGIRQEERDVLPPPPPEPPKGGPEELDAPEAQRRLENALANERDFLESEEAAAEEAGGFGPDSEVYAALDKLDAEKRESQELLDAGDITPEQHVERLERALEDYQAKIGNEDAAYQIEQALTDYAEALGVSPAATRRRADLDPWATPQPQRTPEPPPPAPDQDFPWSDLETPAPSEDEAPPLDPEAVADELRNLAELYQAMNDGDDPQGLYQNILDVAEKLRSGEFSKEEAAYELDGISQFIDGDAYPGVRQPLAGIRDDLLRDSDGETPSAAPSTENVPADPDAVADDIENAADLHMGMNTSDPQDLYGTLNDIADRLRDGKITNVEAAEELDEYLGDVNSSVARELSDAIRNLLRGSDGETPTSTPSSGPDPGVVDPNAGGLAWESDTRHPNYPNAFLAGDENGVYEVVHNDDDTWSAAFIPQGGERVNLGGDYPDAQSAQEAALALNVPEAEAEYGLPSPGDDMFGNPIPGGVTFEREMNLPGGRKVQVFKTPDSEESRLDIAVSEKNGRQTYVLRYQGRAKSNHSSWDEVMAAFDAERDRVAPLHVEDRARRDQIEQERQEAEAARLVEHERRVDEGLDNADRPMPEGWTRTMTPDGEVVLQGPGRYRAFSDSNGKLHVMVRDADGNIATVGSYDDWDAANEAMRADAPRRAQAQRDEFGQWLAGHGFSEDTITKFRATADSGAAMDHLRRDPAFKRMSDAHRDAMEVDMQNPRQRQAADDWERLRQFSRNVETLPEPEIESERQTGDLSTKQWHAVQLMIDDLESGGFQEHADAIDAYLANDRSALDRLDDEDRETIRDELVGRAGQGIQSGELTETEGRELVKLADDMFGVNLPAVDPNDGLIEPVRAPEPESAPTPEPEPDLPASRPAGAPEGFEKKYHPEGVIVDRDGNELYAGKRVVGRRDGAEGEVVAVQQQPPYARIRFDDGRVLVRAGRQLNLLDPAPAAPEAPAPAPEAPDRGIFDPNAVKPARPPRSFEGMSPPRAEDVIREDPNPPAPPALGDVAQEVRDFREGIPRQIGRAGHRDPNQVARRNAGFAIDDALNALNGGDLGGARRRLSVAVGRLRAFPEEQARVAALRDQIAAAGRRPAAPGVSPPPPPAAPEAPAAPAAPAAPQRPAGPVDLAEGRMPADWLSPPQGGNVGPRALDPTTPGVVQPGPADVRDDAARPNANVEEFEEWGDRAGEITVAARTRAGMIALEVAAERGDFMGLEDAVASVFGADGKTKFGRDGYTVEVDQAQYYDNHPSHDAEAFDIEFVVRDGSGNRISGATLRRDIIKDPLTGQWHVYNNEMKFPDEYQGSGFATAWNRHTENWAIANGIKQTRVHAALEKGSAVWALQGFDWDPAFETNKIGLQADRMLDHIKQQARTAAERAQVAHLRDRVETARENRDRSLLPTPMELALIGWRPGLDASGWAGYNGMVQGYPGQGGKDWHGIKHLDPKHNAQRQIQGYAQAREAANRVRAGGGVADVSEGFAQAIRNNEFGDLNLTPTERAEVADVLGGRKSVAGLTGSTKRNLLNWTRAKLSRPAGMWAEDKSNVYQLQRALRAEEAAMAPPDSIGVGRELADVHVDDIARNRVPGWHFVSLNQQGLGGINQTWKGTHAESGQVFFVKNDSFQAGGRDTGAGRNSENDVNKLLRNAGPGGWHGVGENIPSNVNPDMIIQQRVGDNLDLVRRPVNAAENQNGIPGAFDRLANVDEPFRMFVLDVALGNGDRHNGNWQLAHGYDGWYRMFPIDHGLAGGGNGWAGVERLGVRDRINSIGSMTVYQYMKQVAGKLGPEQTEKIFRQSIQDYRDVVENPDFEWADPQFKRRVTQGLKELDREMSKLLKKAGF